MSRSTGQSASGRLLGPLLECPRRLCSNTSATCRTTWWAGESITSWRLLLSRLIFSVVSCLNPINPSRTTFSLSSSPVGPSYSRPRCLTTTTPAVPAARPSRQVGRPVTTTVTPLATIVPLTSATAASATLLPRAPVKLT